MSVGSPTGPDGLPGDPAAQAERLALQAMRSAEARALLSTQLDTLHGTPSLVCVRSARVSVPLCWAWTPSKETPTCHDAMQVARETEQGAVVAELPGGPLDGPIHAAKLDAETVRSTKKRISNS